MSDENSFWHIAGITPIEEKKGDDEGYKVRIPDRLFKPGKAEILELNSDIHWSYEKNTLIAIISNHEPRKNQYEWIGSRVFNYTNEDYKTTIPKEFFTGYQGEGSPETVPEPVRKIELPPGEDVIFTYNDEMKEGEVKSCYVLTEKQYNKRFAKSDVDESLASAPRFS